MRAEGSGGQKPMVTTSRRGRLPRRKPALAEFLRVLWAGGMALALAACGGATDRESAAPSGLTADVEPVMDGTWYKPAADTRWQLQLQGEADTGYDVALYDLDLFDSSSELFADLHAAGRKVICYFSAGSSENWREDVSSFAAADMGKSMKGWSGERWLDIRSANVWRLMLARLDTAVAKGCDGVDPDNVNGFANDTGFDLTASDQLAFNRNLANEAHRRGLAVGLKNDGEQAADLVLYTDFMLNEECHELGECGLLAPFVQAGKPVLNVEYAKDAAAAQTLAVDLCPQARTEGFRTLILPLALDDAFRLDCNAPAADTRRGN